MLFRIDLRTGLPTGRDARLKAVDARNVAALLNEAVATAMQHDASQADSGAITDSTSPRGDGFFGAATKSSTAPRC